MSQKIDPREVLTYLNELGYTNINAQQLKDFITDLKKLIKYENKYRVKENKDKLAEYESIHANKENIDIIDQPLKRFYTSNSKIHSDRYTPQQEQDDIFSQLYTQHTVASKAKENPKKGKHISVHIRRPKNLTDVHNHCLHLESASEYKNPDGDLKLVKNIDTEKDGSNFIVTTESTITSIQPHYNSKQSLETKTPVSKKKLKCSCMKPGPDKPLNKSDPVALYHYYQEQWKKQKFPGQAQHSDLRWAIKEKMQARSKNEGYSSMASVRKRCHCSKR